MGCRDSDGRKAAPEIEKPHLGNGPVRLEKKSRTKEPLAGIFL